MLVLPQSGKASSALSVLHKAAACCKGVARKIQEMSSECPTTTVFKDIPLQVLLSKIGPATAETSTELSVPKNPPYPV
jgi:hypothetical protein